ncbi:MAG: hypothetical protein J6Y68_00480 [Clostridia bacterium]|nr:hypothetical protein [Clostridia bacterium]MBP5592718.1 hypothetical protein [Clostridia bacterium]MBP5648611.1 hypothetical protein [Clostridia bacterium]
MINVICGPVGSGKTDKIVGNANNSLLSCDGNIVFLTDNSSISRNVKPQIRFINVKEFIKYNEDSFLGLLAGILASNADVKKIYIDGLARILNLKADNMEDLLSKIEILADKMGVEVFMTITASKTPSFMKKYIV